MTKVLLFSHEFPPRLGGAGIVARDLAQHLPEEDIEVTILTTKPVNKVGNKLNYKIIEVPTISKIRPIMYWAKIKKMNPEKYKKIIINDIGAAITASLFFSDDLKKKCIVFLHGSEPEKLISDLSKFNKILNIKRKYLDLLTKCHSIVAVSEYMKQKFLLSLSEKHFETKIHVIYNGIDTHQFYPKRIDLHKKLSVHQEKKLILSVSRIVEKKGYSEMFGIIQKLVQTNPLFHWIIIGEGEYLPILKEKIKNNQLEDSVTIVGSIDRSELKEYYSSVEVFLLLSNFDESLGLVYLESIACGTPVIARNQAGAIEVVDVKNGFLVNSNEECLNIFQNKNFKKLEQDIIKASLKKFDINQNIKNLKALISQ